ncbi:MAG: hypothetical protein ACYDBJ_05930 [Aggregatilineales bacterium]
MSLALVVVAVGVPVAFILTRQTQSHPLTDTVSPAHRSRLYRVFYARRAPLVVFGIGLAAIGLGFLPYVVAASHRDFTDRVFIFSEIGAALCVPLGVYAIGSLARRIPIVAPLLFGALLGVAVINGLGRSVGLRYDSSQEQLSLAQLVQQMPHVPDNTAIVIIDDGGYTADHWWMFALNTSSFRLEAAVRYLYQQPSLAVRLCYPDRGAWGEAQEQCLLESNGVRLSVGNDPGIIYPYSRVVAFDYQPEQGFTLLRTWPIAHQTAQNASAIQSYNPFKLIDANAPPPARVHTLLSSWPYVPFVPKQISPTRSVTLDIPYLSLNVAEQFQDPFIGDGWSGAWTAAKTATVNVWLAPISDYQITFRVTWSLLPEILKSLTMSVNGQPIALSTTPDVNGGTIFTGIIPQATIALDPTNTLLAFHTDKVVSPKSIGMNTDERLLGVWIDWLHIDPVTPATASSGIALASILQLPVQ